MAVRWRQYRLYPKQFVSSAGNSAMAGLAGYRMQGEGYPAIFDIEAHPREENNIGAWTAWVVSPYVKLTGEYQKSGEKYPNPKTVSLTQFASNYREPGSSVQRARLDSAVDQPGRGHALRANLTNLKGESMKLIKVVVLCVAALTPVATFAQNEQSNTNMQILLDKVKADKKLVVAANMGLNDAEGKGFWPIYEAYQKDLQALNDRLKKTILAYADAYNKNTLTDELATRLTNEALAIDQDEITMRKTYSARLGKVLPGKQAARYLQIENKIRAAIRYDLAEGIPLVQ
jgi:hypothetical protein